MWTTLLAVSRIDKGKLILLCVGIAIAGYVATLKWQLNNAQLETEKVIMVNTQQRLELANLTAEVARVNANAKAEQERLQQSLAVIDKLNSRLKHITDAKVKYIKATPTDGTCKGAVDLLRNHVIGGAQNAEKTPLPN